jgi:putative membrane protein
MNSSGKPQDPPLHRHFRVALAIITILHCVGLFGLNSRDYQVPFERVTSLDLFLSFILVMYFHMPFDRRFFLFCLFAFVVGMAAEIAGVHTGDVFGIYHYTPSFGWQLMVVPLIIGVNWILLSYISAELAARYLRPAAFRAIAAGFVMVLIDLLLEHFAIRHHLWIWASSPPPLQNYIAWFLISIIIQAAYIRLIPDTRNILARYYLAILLLFLAADLILSLYGRTF